MVPNPLKVIRGQRMLEQMEVLMGWKEQRMQELWEVLRGLRGK